MDLVRTTSSTLFGDVTDLYQKSRGLSSMLVFPVYPLVLKVTPVSI